MMMHMSGVVRQKGQFGLKFMLIISVLFLIMSVLNIVMYSVNWIRCLGLSDPQNFVMFAGDGLMFIAGVLGLRIAIKKKFPSNGIIYTFIGVGVVGISATPIYFIGKYQIGIPFNIAISSIAEGMTAIGLIGFLCAGALTK
jgi:hypothetical protein